MYKIDFELVNTVVVQGLSLSNLKPLCHTPVIVLLALALLFFACHHKKKATSKPAPTVSAPKKKPVAPAPQQPQGSPQLTHAALLSEKLGLSENEIARNKLLLFVDDWYGVPYKYGGCQKSGIDCSCFASLLCEKVYNLKIARQASDIYKACEKLTPDEMKEGDLVFFKISGNAVSHVGIYLRKRLFVHSSTSKGVIINSMDEAYYKKYFHAGGRVRHL